MQITGAHYLLYSEDPDADRAFFRDVLNFRSVDLGHNWLIFALPPAEMAVHPGDFAQRHADHRVLGSVLYLMCDDVRAFVQFLLEKNVGCTEIDEAEWGVKTTVPAERRGDRAISANSRDGNLGQNFGNKGGGVLTSPPKRGHPLRCLLR